ncbi:uncharacterized protein PV07_09978 [Cladophialophora immunda]|uniref:FAD/NAD(P)-binding domain-containing protein n=1 Tax=Cladophialophora immunda TaxID=569365 RepID=A0A0D2C180_9EURO|nr:uncharacterized protein PV07_09978 [Cladophialophora immunda]KIW24250.1 hypothetical protein PV07_09978 [Cladophialophora immunda]
MGSNSTRGRILVVGAGYGSLSCAIELHRKGFEVEVLESASKLTTQGMSQILEVREMLMPQTYEKEGDMLQFSSNASRVMRT